MKIRKFIKLMQAFEAKHGDIEVLLADRAISGNHTHGESRKIEVFKTYYELANGQERKGICLGIEDPMDSIPPSADELESFDLH